MREVDEESDVFNESEQSSFETEEDEFFIDELSKSQKLGKTSDPDHHLIMTLKNG